MESRAAAALVARSLAWSPCYCERGCCVFVLVPNLDSLLGLFGSLLNTFGFLIYVCRAQGCVWDIFAERDGVEWDRIGCSVVVV